MNTHTPDERPVAILGLGYVGLPLAVHLARAGLSVLGLDIDASKLERLHRGESYLGDVEGGAVRELTAAGRLRFSGDYGELSSAQAILICVPTPVTEVREPDLQYVVATARAMAPHLQRGQLVVLESTTYPGTTEEVIRPLLEASGLRSADGDAAPDFFLAYSPERIDPGNRRFALRDIPKLVGGVNPASAERARQLYARAFDRVVVLSSARAAEMAKLLENIYRAVNVALVNELKLLCQPLGVDVWEVIDAAATKPFGYAPFYPGPGLGGHCLPIDPFYLAWKARQHGLEARFVELAGEINTAMPAQVVETVARALAARGKQLQGARVLVLGVAYKKDVDDIRESPGLAILAGLAERGAEVAYNDPHVPQLPHTRRYDFSHLRSVPLDAQTLAGFDGAVLVTDHSAYDMTAIVRDVPFVVDTRNATHGVACAGGKVIRC